VTSVVRWAIEKTPAMNAIMVVVLAVGAFAGFRLHREEFPRFQLEIILVTVPYPGASPEEVEQGICQKIEEAVRSIDGIKKVTSIAQEDTANVVIELHSDVPDVSEILAEVESEVDRISSFPQLSEEPEIRQLTMRNPAITVGVVCTAYDADDAERRLRDVTERVRDELLEIPAISVATIKGERPYQIDVEIPEQTLRAHGLSLSEVAARIRRQNLELPGGNIRDDSEEVLLRGKNKRLTGPEIAELPLVTQRNGAVLTVRDLATVRDGLLDTTAISEINGHPGLAITVEAAAQEDLLAMADAVNRYVAEAQLPHGFHFEVWGDTSVNVRDRLDLLRKNGLQGLALVFLVLALFLEFRLAFWVALGIPVSMFGACAVLWQFDQSLNMLSMFAFLIALGIVVDDAIVIGENIYAHRESGKTLLQAAVVGTVEVLPSVATSVLTTIFAFMPMFFVSGVMGKFFAVLPLAVIAMLVISLLESTLILPCHLAHSSSGETLTLRAIRFRHTSGAVARVLVAWPLVALAFVADQVFYPFRVIAGVTNWAGRGTSRILQLFVDRLYLPLLHRSIRHPVLTLSVIMSVLIGTLSLVRGGVVPFIFFPDLDSPQIEAQVVFPSGTPRHVTDAATRQMAAAIRQVDADQGEQFVKIMHRKVGQVSSRAPGQSEQRTDGSHVGAVTVELVDTSERSLNSTQIMNLWREATGTIPGVDSLTFGSLAHAPGGTDIEFKLLAPAERMADLEEAVEVCKTKLAGYRGVRDITDDSRPGKQEMQLRIKDRAMALGVPLETVAQTVRAAYYGEEVMRLQRGRHEVKLMVRYPEDERTSLAQFEDIRVPAADGIARPITELAEIKLERGYSEINRIDQRRSITISADVDETQANAARIVREMQHDFLPTLLSDYPDVRVRWEGQQEQTVESVQSLFIGLAIALLATYVLLTMEFNSYVQPMIVMSVIPFAAVGALWGHAAMGLSLTLFSVLGLVALTGVVVNDSIVLVDFINARLRSGMPLETACMEAGRRRLRPVLLTSLTTIAGLLPILTERSFQAQMLIPMASSLCFGLAFSTVLVLVLVPTLFRLYGRVVGLENAGSPHSEPQPTRLRKSGVEHTSTLRV